MSQPSIAAQARARMRHLAENIQDVPEKGSESETGDASVSADTTLNPTGVTGDDGAVVEDTSVLTPSAPDMSNDSLSPNSATAEQVDVEKEVNNAGDTVQDPADQEVDPETGSFTTESFPQNMASRTAADSEEDSVSDPGEAYEEEPPGEDEPMETEAARRRREGHLARQIEDKIWASLRLADIRSQVGTAEHGDLITEAQAIARSANLDAIRVETTALTAVARRQRRQPTAGRRLNPVTATAAPSLATAPDPMRVLGAVDDDIDQSWLG